MSVLTRPTRYHFLPTRPTRYHFLLKRPTRYHFLLTRPTRYHFQEHDILKFYNCYATRTCMAVLIKTCHWIMFSVKSSCILRSYLFVLYYTLKPLLTLSSHLDTSVILSCWNQANRFNWFLMMPSIATKFQYVNSLLFSFSLTTCFGPYGPSSGEIYN
jgi:hypothetical protein